MREEYTPYGTASNSLIDSRGKEATVRRNLSVCMIPCTVACIIPITAASTTREPPDIYLFPIERDVDVCSEAIYKWIYEHVGRITVSCSHLPIFKGGIQDREDDLMKAGVGFYPYIVIENAGPPSLKVAVTLPNHKPEETDELRILADDATHVMSVGPPVRRMVLLFRDIRLVSYDLPPDAVPAAFLQRLAGARIRQVAYGENGRRSMKISNGNARAIGEMTSLYIALAKDAGKRIEGAAYARECCRPVTRQRDELLARVAEAHQLLTTGKLAQLRSFMLPADVERLDRERGTDPVFDEEMRQTEAFEASVEVAVVGDCDETAARGVRAEGDHRSGDVVVALYMTLSGQPEGEGGPGVEYWALVDGRWYLKGILPNDGPVPKPCPPPTP